MAHIPTTENDIEKVFRIAKVLGIGIEEAAITCDAFHLAFSDDRMRRAIFDIVDELDRSAARKGEPLGLIINYTVELGSEGIRVARYADEIPEGEVVELVPLHRANIFLRIVDNFPKQEFLGPLIVNRPEPLIEEQYPWERDGSTSDNELPSLVKEGWQTDAFCRADGVVCSEIDAAVYSDSDLKPAILLGPSSLESPTTVICLGPIRLKFNERFPLAGSGRSRCGSPHVSKGLTFNVRQRSANGEAYNSPRHLPPWAAMQAGTPAFQSMSGLSPPLMFGESGTLRRERCSSVYGNRSRDMCLTFGSLKISSNGFVPALVCSYELPRSLERGYGTREVPALAERFRLVAMDR